MKINKTLVIIIIIIVILIIVRIIFFGKDEAQPPNTGGPKATQVSGVVVTGTNLDEVIYATGSVMANEEVLLTPELSGRIIKLNIQEGTKVNKGDLLVKLIDSDYQAQLRKLNSQLQLLNESSDRQKTLLDMNGVSKEEYDAMMNQVSAVTADIDYVRAQVSKTEIRAPFSGQIGLRFVSEGSTVMVGDRIASIQQLNPVKIDFSIPEKYAGTVMNGDKIRFTIEGQSDNFIGKIYASEPKVDPTTRTLRLRAVCENPDGKIFPGAFARIQLILNRNDSALMVPTQAIIPILKGKKVFSTVNGKVASREVTTGTRTDELIEITSGIEPGDTVITTGIMQLRDSMPVKVIVKQNN